MEAPIPENQFKLLWENAFEMYAADTKRDLKNDGRLRQLTNLDDLMTILDNNAASFTEFRQKRARLREKFNFVLGPVIGITGFLKDMIPGTPGALASPLLVAISYLVETGGRVSQAYDFIENVFAELEEFSTRLREYLDGGLDERLRGKITAILSCFLQIIGKSEKLIAKGRFKLYLKQAFLSTDEDTKALLDGLQKLISQEQQLVTATIFKITKNTQRDISAAQKDLKNDIVAARDALQNDFKGFHQGAITKEAERKLNETLKTPMLERVYILLGEFQKRLLRDTGNWLRREQAYQDWLAGFMPFLFILGEPGSGKTHLAVTIIDEAKMYSSSQGERNPNKESQRGPTSTAFFFFRETDQQLLDANSMLKTIAYQILESDPGFKRHAIGVCSSPLNTITADHTWKNLFLDYYRSAPGCLYIVLDGLDEAPKKEQSQVFDFLKSISRESGDVIPQLRIVILCRPTVQPNIKLNKENTIYISRDSNKHDVERYIDLALSNVAILERLKASKPRKAEKERAVLKARISQLANGVFLWAQLLLDHIKEMELDGIKEALEKPPTEVTAMIDGIFTRLAREDPEPGSLQKMLTWAVCSTRPLYFRELAFIMSLPSMEPREMLWQHLNTRYSTVFWLNMPEETKNESGDSTKGEDDEANHYESEGYGMEFNQESDEIDIEEIYNRDDQDKKDHQSGGYENDNIEVDDEDEDDENVEKVENENQNKNKDDDDEDADDDDEEDDDDNEDDNDDDDDDDDDDEDENEDENEDEAEGLDELLWSIEDIDERTLKTEVTFSHIQFRDVLLSERTSGVSTVIRVDPQNCHKVITLTCFDILQLRLDDSGYPSISNFLGYPIRNIMYHLSQISIEDVSADDTKKIIQNLYWLFHEESGAYSYLNILYDDNLFWQDIWNVWIPSNINFLVIRKWFERSAKYGESFKREDLEWMAQAATSAKCLFRSWMTVCARLWLERKGHGPEEPRIFFIGEQYCYFMHALSSMDEEGSVESQEIKAFSFLWRKMGSLSIENIEHLSTFAPECVQKTYHWYQLKAVIMRDQGFPTEAMILFQKAMQVDPKGWGAYESIARAYGEKGEYEKAITYMRKASEAVSGLWDLRDQYYAFISHWKIALNDNEGALDAAEIAYSRVWHAPLPQHGYLDALLANGKYREVQDLLEMLCSTTHGERLLVVNLINGLVEWDIFILLRRIFEKLGKTNLEFLINGIKKAWEDLESSGLHWEKKSHSWKTAQIVYEYGQSLDLEYIMEKYELAHLLFEEFSDGTDQEIRDRQYVKNLLARQYYDAAVSAHVDGEEASSKSVKKLKSLAQATPREIYTARANISNNLNYASMLWGRWRKYYEKAKKIKWKKCFSPTMLELLKALEASDSKNNTTEMYKLAEALLQTGDEENAIAIFALAFTHEQKSGSHAGGGSNSILRNSDCARCNGDCETDSIYESLYMCVVCNDRKFCEKCIEKVKSDGLKRRDCNPNHTFSKIWPSDGRLLAKVALEIQPGKFSINPEWIEDLKQFWVLKSTA